MIRAILLLLALAGPALAETVTLPDGRWYRIDLPPETTGAPILLGLHGGGGNPDQFARNSGLSAPALAQGYAVIYPAGSSRRSGTGLLTWNAGSCCAHAAVVRIDDVAFLDAVIADAARRFGLDGSRVYLTGMSNGAMMAERYAAQRPENVRAVAGVSGTLDDEIAVEGPVPLLLIHGTADDHVPYEGGRGQRSLTRSVNFASVDSTVAAFVAAGGPGLVTVQGQIDTAEDGMRTRVTEWLRPDGVAQVRLLAVEGGGHVWPGGRRAARGGGTQDFTANDEILRFFAAHP
jgi:polyhydroxybutyrate depolymerase